MLALPILALAQNDTATSSNQGQAQQRQEQAQQAQEERQQTITQNRETGQTPVATRIEERVRRFSDLMVARFEAVADRLTRIADRLESRIAKFKESGVDTVATEGYLADARVKIGLAKTEIGNISSALNTALSGDINADTFRQVRTIVGSAKQALKDAHAALVKVVVSLKPGLNTDKPASSTESASDDNS